MDMIRRFVPAKIEQLGDDQCLITLATRSLALDGDEWVMEGADLSHYEQHPILLFNHQPETPVARASNIERSADNITAVATFPPPGVSPKADEIRGLVKCGILTGVSAGILPLESEPLDPAKPRAGRKITNWKLLEGSFVSVPADTSSTVTGRAAAATEITKTEKSDWRVGASRNLPIEDSDDWDGPAAEASIFEWAGGDDFEASKARKGFLTYDAANPDERGSYKLPIAHVVDGRLKVPKGAIRAAAARLPQADIPDDVKADAQKVIDHYEEKAGMGEKDKERRVAALRKRMLVVDPKLKLRGLYDVAQFAYLLEQVGYIKTSASWESAIEGDESLVPAMVGEGLVALGKAFIAMAEEECLELLANANLSEAVEDEKAGDVVVIEERGFVGAWRRAQAGGHRRSGRALSKASTETLRSALGLHKDAMNLHDTALEGHATAGKMHDRAAEHIRCALKSAGATGADGMGGLDDDEDGKDGTPAETVRCMRSALGLHQDANEMHDNAGETQRSAMKLNERCAGEVRGLLNSKSDPEKDAAASSDPAVDAAGNASATGADTATEARAAAYRRRQADLLGLTTV